MKRFVLKWKKSVLAAAVFFIVVFVITLWFHSVDNSITSEDKAYIEKFLLGIEQTGADDAYERQIAFIKAIQNAVLTRAPANKGIQFNGPREPKDLYIAEHGLCFDRSRVIEKILKENGFETRHIFVYSIRDRNTFTAFLTPGVASHAITEVLTQKGWLVVDSNDRWISTDQNGAPQGMTNLRLSFDNEVDIKWESEPPAVYRDIAPYTFVYGLYSRHGRFFPPYDPIPDINYGEFIDNF